MLPKIKTVTYVVNLPHSGKIEYRPFLVKEEGCILTAMEFGKEEDVLATLKNVMQECIKNDININDLLMIEFIYLVILLRTKSKSSMLELITRCDECDEQFNFSINLDEKEFFINKENIKMLIDVNKELSIEIQSMKTAELDSYFKLEKNDNKIDSTLELFSRLITKIVYEKKLYIEFTPEEVKENILSNLTASEFEIISKKMDEMIKFKLEHAVTCPKCGANNIRIYDEPLSFLS